MTRSGLASQLNLLSQEPTLSMHPAEANKAGLKTGAIVCISNTLGKMKIRLQHSKHVNRSEVFAPMHYSSEHYSEGSINRLVSANIDPTSKQP
ncbi:MAG: hypothetical protein MJK04_24200, partial [Psychrosphaera sp.]|nr:hypothetical protein [Psychrosphaera sp.]